MLEDLRDYGLIWQRRVCSCIFFHLPFASHFAVKPTSRRFNPTRLATTLTSSSLPLPTSTGSSSGSKEGFIVLETNYRVYAYTGIFSSSSFVFTMQLLTSCACVENPLQTAVLNLFVSLKYRFPNLVVGSITRESVRKALTNGITADQVCQLLYTLRAVDNSINRSLVTSSATLILR